jgi:ketosteroid isomerase-like protein
LIPTTGDAETQLRELAAGYALAADDRDPDAFVALFCPNGVLTVVRGEREVTLSGRDELRRVPGQLGRYERTFHLVGQSHYQVDGDTATGTVYCTANHLLDGVNAVMHMRYRDRYAMGDDGRWCIESRRAVVEWSERRDVD